MNKTEYLTKRISGLRAVVAVLLAIIMAASIVLGVGFGVYGKNTDDWFKPKQDANQEQNQLVVTEQKSHGITLLSGVATTATDGTLTQNIKATITPANATDKTVAWSVKFKNANSSWATGKNISDYVTINFSSKADGTLCVVSCHKAFGEQIILTCTSNDNQEISAQATLDYVKRITGVNFTLLDENKTSVTAADFSMIDKKYYVRFTPMFSDGTIEETGIHYSYSVWSNANFISEAIKIRDLQSGMLSTVPIDRSDIAGMVLTANTDLEFKTGLRVAYDFLNIDPNKLRDINLQNTARQYYANNASQNKSFMTIKVSIYGAHSTTAEYECPIKLGVVNFNVSVSGISLDTDKITF